MKSLDIPVYVQAKELMNLARTFESIVEDDETGFNKTIAQEMIANTYIIGAKIVAAEGSFLYGHKLDTATIVKLTARELQAQTNMLRGLCNDEHIDMFRDEIEKFRILFLEWVSTFNKEEDISDEWDFRHL